MLTDLVAHKVRDLASPLAEFISRQPFDQATEIVAELYDLVNERRDNHIGRAHALILDIMSKPEWPNVQLINDVKVLNRAISMMEGTKCQSQL